MNLKSYTYLLFFFFSLALMSQNTNKDILTSYQQYTELPREITYAHLNKSTYIKGEVLGFCAYVLDKSNKQISTLTKNLYCSISDDKGKIIKKKLLKVENGISNGLFEIDSLFTSGNYIFKVYTNWMKNFNEQNLFVQSIKIVSPDFNYNSNSDIIQSKIDAQFLPEGGHLVCDIQNTIGVVIKDNLGFGIPYIKGELLEDNEVITNFEVNNLGIGRFIFNPKANKNYEVKFNYLNKTHVFNLQNALTTGIVMSVIQNNNGAVISLKTNNETHPKIMSKNYKLLLHNGKKSTLINITFNDDLEINKFINFKDLFSGINIFTLFDNYNTPLLERSFFNYNGINFINSENTIIKKESDSLLLKLSYPNIDPNKFNNLSISILPENSISYHQNHNIASYCLIQPYLKGYIENAKYYFTEINRKKKYELDNLLLTQGWSSYDWNTIFNNPPNSYYAFENGIGIIANVIKPNLNKYILYPVGGNSLKYLTLSEKEKTLQIPGLFPTDREKINITEINSNGELKKPQLSLQFFPSSVPDIDLSYNVLIKKEHSVLNEFKYQEKTQKLDEIIISSKIKQTRIEKLKIKSPYSKIDLFDNIERNTNQTLADYLRQRGYTVTDHRGEVRISTIDPRTIGEASPVFIPPTIYLDGAQMSDLSFLSDYGMQWVDYVDINKNGIGEGVRGGGGVIKIFTLPNEKRAKIDITQIKTIKTYNIPISFSLSKKFYTPQYESLKNDFFKEYGVIEWLPVNKIDENHNYNFKIYNTETPNIKLLIQGIANDGSYISEEKIVHIN